MPPARVTFLADCSHGSVRLATGDFSTSLPFDKTASLAISLPGMFACRKLRQRPLLSQSFIKENFMTPKNENRIWRTLFLAAIVGFGIAAGTADRAPTFVSINDKGDCLTSDGQIYRYNAVGNRLDRKTN